MPKHSRKRQRTDKGSENYSQPLGAQTLLTNDAAKDDEERRLESMLFGTPFVPSGKGKGPKDLIVVDDDEEHEIGEDAGRELEGLLDNDLFFVDTGDAPKPNYISELDAELDVPEDSVEPGTDEDEEDDAEEDASKASDSESDADEPAQPPTKPTSDPLSSLRKSRKAPAWTDPDDSTLKISLTSSHRTLKLRDAPSEDSVGGREYERRLRRQYEKIHPPPDWAVDARKKGAEGKRRRIDGEDEEDMDVEEEADELYASSGGILGEKKSGKLEAGVLNIERLRDANQAAQAEGEIKAIQFHPSPQVPVLLTASADRRIRLFNIDGHTNPHLQTLHIPSLPVTTAQFHPTGSSILLTGPRPFYYTHDLQSGATLKSPRGLWGTTFNSTNTASQDLSMEVCSFNPTGDVLAVAGRRGYVHLVDWKAGSGQVVGSVKANAGVKAMWWSRGAGGGRELMTLGEDAEIYVWDVSERRCLRRWKDEGGFGSKVMSGDRAGNYVAVGSKSGIVNVYGSDATNSSSFLRPKPLKAIGNLTTSITSARFNHDSQLLAIASNTKKDQMRLIHLPSMTAFSNWPTSSTPLGHVTSIDFSAGSEYVAVGNNRGRVLLYHLKDFAPS